MVSSRSSRYTCAKRNWSDFGGASVPIIRYLPQVGSGIRTFFIQKILDDATPPDTCPAGSPLKTMQENTGTTVRSADRAAAIMPYSTAQWVAQANGTVPDSRANAFIGTFDGVVDTNMADSTR